MMRHSLTLIGFAISQVVIVSAAQPVHAQAVQLPTFNQFSTNSSVLVPDRGSAYLGGVSRSTMGRNESGVPGLSKLPVAGRPFGNRATSGSSSSSGVSVNAFIHDFEAMDEALHQQVAATRGGRESFPPTSLLTPSRVGGNDSRPLAVNQSITAIRQQQSVQHAAERQREATAQTDYLTRADQLLAEGKPNVARIYLEMAAKRAGNDPAQAELKQQIAARLQLLQRPAAVVNSTAR